MNFNPEFWFLLGLVLIILEVVMGFTIVLFFTSLAAFTVGFISYEKFVVFESVYWQFAAFFALTVFWAILLWKPLKRLKDRNAKNGEVKNFVGQAVEVIDADLTKNKTGNVKWSGTIVHAILHPEFREETLPVGTIAKIVDVRDKIFVVIRS
jgi:membrane protein implicated in regulation of membrane protease activity